MADYNGIKFRFAHLHQELPSTYFQVSMPSYSMIFKA